MLHGCGCGAAQGADWCLCARMWQGVPKLSSERLRESNDFAHSPTNREKQAFGIHGWGCAATVKFDAFPTSTFEPDTSFLLTQRIAAREQNPAATGAFSPTSTRHLAGRWCAPVQ
jgi:hypothetical protein